MSRILGFRSGKAWKKVIASIVYLFIIFMAYGWATDKGSTPTAAPTTNTTSSQTPASSSASTSAETKGAEEKAQAETNKVPGTIGLKPDEFTERWNSNASSQNIPELKIPKINVENGQTQNTFQITFNSSHVILGTVNKQDGSIRDVMIMAGGQELSNPTLAANVLLSWGLLIQTTSPDLSAYERGNVLSEVGAIGDNVDFKNADKYAIRGKIQYHLFNSEFLGLFFGVSDIKDGK